MSAKVLCLVDCPLAKANLEARLSSSYEVEFQPTILAALHSLRKEIPQAIVVQMHLQNESCFDFLSTLENNSEYLQIPVVTCCVENVFDKNIEDYLMKATRCLGSKTYLRCQDFYSEKLPMAVSDCIACRTLPAAC